MASLFKFNDFTKEGKGVSKNAPKKRGFFVFFERFFSSFWQLITVNCWFVLLSIPVITSGLGNVGITYVCRSVARGQHSFGTSDFFDSVRKNWKQALAVGIINILFTALLLYSAASYFAGMMQAKSTFSFSTVCFGMVAIMLIIFTMMQFYIYTLIVTFDFKLSKLYRNAFSLAIIGLKRNLLVVVCLLPIYAILVAMALLLGNIGLIAASFISVAVMPVFSNMVIQYNTFPIIKRVMIDPYYAQHPGEDIEKRRRLGLDIAEDELGDDDTTVFTDTIQK